MKINLARIALGDALHLKSAEYWLQLGEPLQAFRELARLSRRATKHPWTADVWLQAFRASHTGNGSLGL